MTRHGPLSGGICDDPTWSAFWRYFHLNFAELGLKKLISTHYDRTEPTYKMEYEGGDDNNVEVGVKTPLEGNGDFRNKECLDLLDECDIVVTNPPFSLARAYVQYLREHNKQFVIIGDLNWITYKEIFPMLKDNEIWLGYSSVKEFTQPDGTIKKFGNKLWYTNLDIQKRHEKLILWQRYYDDDGNPLPDAEERYPHYDNYDAINVDRVADIPMDYQGVMGVPITFLNGYNPEQFEIVELSRYLNHEGMSKKFVETYYKQGGKGQIKEGHPDLCYYDDKGKAIVPYMRVLIKKTIA